MEEATNDVLCLDCGALRGPLERQGFSVHELAGLAEVARPDDALSPRAIILGGEVASELSWERLMPRVREVWPLVDVALWRPRASASLVRQALRSGVRDVLLTSQADRAARQIRSMIDQQQLLPRAQQADAPTSAAGEFEGMRARSRVMADLFETAAQVAQSNAAVLILGESGTGKELLARAIHRRSGREGRFVALNCAAVPEMLIDSELFGHVEGAFTGATKPKPGLFRHADGGTLLLDELGRVPLPVQYRLLRVLQEGAVRPVGAPGEVPVDVRVIAATSDSLADAVADGTFREDLFYRLDVIRITVPPLRDRAEDIIYLFAHFARRFADEYRLRRPDVTDGFLDELTSYAWPGNVRQLENFTERLVLTESDTVVTANRLRQLVGLREPAGHTAQVGPARAPLALDKPMKEALQPHVDDLERAYLEGLLARTGGMVGEAAQRAGVSRRTMTRLLGRLDIDKMDFRGDGDGGDPPGRRPRSAYSG